jgi:hypothetical protein
MPATASGAAPYRATALRADRGSTADTGTTTAHTTHCTHQPACPTPDAADRYRAHVVAAHPEQGWSLLCNGVIVFDDLGAVLPGRRLIPAQRR